VNKLRDEIHENARAKGFYDNEREIGTLLMLIVSEIAEAMEADRKCYRATKIDFVEKQEGESFVNHFRDKVKDTFEDELADTIIRVLDLCGYMDIDIDKHVALKMRYNKEREKMHGKRY
jgi:NTP pyrophosphatase (non-canonical NTP hydrolase)